MVICLERGSTAASVNAVDPRRIDVDLSFWSPIYKISYDLSYDYRKFIVRSTSAYDSDLKRAEISLMNTVIYEHYI